MSPKTGTAVAFGKTCSASKSLKNSVARSSGKFCAKSSKRLVSHDSGTLGGIAVSGVKTVSFAKSGKKIGYEKFEKISRANLRAIIDITFDRGFRHYSYGIAGRSRRSLVGGRDNRYRFRANSYQLQQRYDYKRLSSSIGYHYRLQADWLPRYRVGPFAQETSVAPRWAAGLPLERIRWLPVVGHAGYLAELVIGQFVRRPGRHGRRNGEGHGHSIADGASDRRTTGFVQWCGALRPIIHLQLPDPDPLRAGTCRHHQNRGCVGRDTEREHQWPCRSLGPPCGAEVGWGGGRTSGRSIIPAGQNRPRLREPQLVGRSLCEWPDAASLRKQYIDIS